VQVGEDLLAVGRSPLAADVAHFVRQTAEMREKEPLEDVAREEAVAPEGGIDHFSRGDVKDGHPTERNERIADVSEIGHTILDERLGMVFQLYACGRRESG
jgi:hypothetical protein